jgi:hypothetical protein
MNSPCWLMKKSETNLTHLRNLLQQKLSKESVYRHLCDPQASP